MFKGALEVNKLKNSNLLLNDQIIENNLPLLHFFLICYKKIYLNQLDSPFSKFSFWVNRTLYVIHRLENIYQSKEVPVLTIHVTF